MAQSDLADRPVARWTSTLRRHQLLRLSAAGWARVLEAPWDAGARDCLMLWAQRGLPLVVTRQPTADVDTIATGLPAPARFRRRKLALAVAPGDVMFLDEFLPAGAAGRLLPRAAAAPWQALLARLKAGDCAARVYGGYGWQALTRLAYVHAQSDVDLLLPVNSPAHADAVAEVLVSRTTDWAGPRLDGELLFPDGGAIAWREWVAHRAGAAPQVLVKRLHGVALERPEPASNAGSAAFHAALGRAATVSLYDELALAPKPGLVSFADTGSHADMDAGTFLRSLFALRHYFVRIAAQGAASADFAPLEALGIAAEERMLRATGGVNTHRGAIFTLGLLCAAAGAAHARGHDCDATTLRATLRSRWGDALAARARRTRDSHGQRAARAHGLRSAADEAAQGLPTLFERVLPALRAARAAGADDRGAKLHALFTAMAEADDTNLAHRGGLQGLIDAKSLARRFLAEGGGLNDSAAARAAHVHALFVERRLSPGGAADLLAAACWVERVERLRDAPPR
jgi:triphosphoribosyl-dephospho-CoA synthase